MTLRSHMIYYMQATERLANGYTLLKNLTTLLNDSVKYDIAYNNGVFAPCLEQVLLQLADITEGLSSMVGARPNLSLHVYIAPLHHMIARYLHYNAIKPEQINSYKIFRSITNIQLNESELQDVESDGTSQPVDTDDAKQCIQQQLHYGDQVYLRRDAFDRLYIGFDIIIYTYEYMHAGLACVMPVCIAAS